MIMTAHVELSYDTYINISMIRIVLSFTWCNSLQNIIHLTVTPKWCNCPLQMPRLMGYFCVCGKSVAAGRRLLWPLPRVRPCLPGAADWTRSPRDGAQSSQGAQDLWAETNVRARYGSFSPIRLAWVRTDVKIVVLSTARDTFILSFLILFKCEVYVRSWLCGPWGTTDWALLCPGASGPKMPPSPPSYQRGKFPQQGT